MSFGLSVALTYRLLPVDPSLSERFAFFGSPPRAWELAAGGLLALSRLRLRGALADAAGVVGTALLAVAVFVFDDGTPFPGLPAVVPVAAAGLLVLAGSDAGGPASRVLSWAPARRLGDLSYGWYLWHWPFIVFARALFPGSAVAPAVAAALSLGPAWLSYVLVEQRIRNHRPRTVWPTLRIGVICVLLPLVVAGCALPVGRRVDRSIEDFAAEVRTHVDVRQGCDVSQANRSTREACTWAAPGTSAGTIVLLGDSNAGQLSEGVLAAAEDLGSSTVIQTRSRCPFVDLVVVVDAVVDDACRRHYEEQLALIVEDPPGTVVLGSSTDGYLRADEVVLRDGLGGPTARGPGAKAEAWERALGRTVAALTEQGVGVVIVHPVPKFEDWNPQACAAAMVLVDEERCATSEALAPMLARRAPAVRAESASVGPGVVAVDVTARLCPDERCEAHHDGRWWWRDGDHISVYASGTLAPALAAAIEEAGGP